MLLAEATENHEVTSNDYTRTPYVWQGLFLVHPFTIVLVYAPSLTYSIKIA